MTTRLTKAIREEIVHSMYIASDLPKELDALKRNVINSATAIFKRSLPKGFNEAIANHPKEWFDRDTGLYMSTVMYAGSTEPKPGVYHSSHIQFDDPIPTPMNFDANPAVKETKEWVAKIHKPVYDAWLAKKEAFDNAAHALVNAHRTTEALIKAAPEIAKYVPKTSFPVPAVPTNDVMRVLERMGVALDRGETI
jgi:hypothetical protein